MSIYSSEHVLFRESVKKFCEKKILPYVTDWEEKKFFPSDIFKSLGDEGFLGILLDDKWGGVGLDYIYAAAWCEEFGKVPSLGFTTGINMHSLVISPTVQRFASEEQKNKWLPGCVKGDYIGAYAFTEPGAGSDLSQVRTKAEKKGNEYILNGSKIFITNGARADFVLVMAKTDPDAGYKGFTTFIVDTSLDGFSVARSLDKLGWHCSDTAELVFEDVRISEDAVLGKVGDGWKQAMGSLEWERLMLSLLSIAGITQCMKETFVYANDRSAFGQSVGSFPINSDRLIRYQSVIESSRSLAQNCVLMLQNGDYCRKEVSILKRYICELAFEIADYCLQLHGGYGYTTEFLPERWLRDLRLNSIGGGTTEIMQRVIEKEIWN